MPRTPTSRVPSKNQLPGGLFRHSLRPEWGVAVLAWEERGRRAYQFDDGRLRVFKQGYYSLFEPVAEQGFVADALEDELLRTAEASGTEGPQLESVYPFDTQIAIFRELFPEGFAGRAWKKGHRGLPEHKRLKRHRGAAVEDAQARLAPEVVTALCDDGRYDETIDEMVAVLAATNLVSSSGADRLAGMAADAVGPVARSFRDLLTGERRYGARFMRFVAALHAACDKAPSWRLATALPALVMPQEHVCVRRSVFLKQAATVAPGLRYTKRPRRRGYQSFRSMALQARDRLADAGLPPQDLLDVHDFIWLTLRPAAAKLLD